MQYNLKHQSNRLNKNKIINNQIIILFTTIEEGKAKDGKIIDKEEIKDGKIIKGVDKIEMASLAEMGIIEIMEIGKEGI